MATITPVNYSYPGPPFNFLGHFSLSQWNSLQKWVGLRQGDVTNISTFHRIRAEQLRKTAGILEQYFSTVYPKEPDSYGQSLAPTFKKPAWQPGPNGHFNYPVGDDHLPMVMTGRIKAGMQEVFQRDDDAVFYMNQVRCLIEAHEDMAQTASDFVADPPAGSTQSDPQTLSQLLTKISSYFGQPAYQLILIDDVNAANMYKGMPYGRVSQADNMTQFELESANHSQPSTPIAIVDKGVITPSTS